MERLKSVKNKNNNNNNDDTRFSFSLVWAKKRAWENDRKAWKIKIIITMMLDFPIAPWAVQAVFFLNQAKKEVAWKLKITITMMLDFPARFVQSFSRQAKRNMGWSKSVESKKKNNNNDDIRYFSCFSLLFDLS